MPRILSLDKMLQDLRGAAAADNAKQGFMQGMEQGRASAGAAQGQAQGAASALQTHPGQQPVPETPPQAGGISVHPDNDQLAEQYFRNLAQPQPNARPELAELDAAHGSPNIPQQGEFNANPPPLPPELAGLSQEELAMLEDAARNPPQLAATDYGFGGR